MTKPIFSPSLFGYLEIKLVFKTQALIKAKFQWDDKNYKKNLRKVKIKATHMVILWDEETNRLDF